jgi:uncharacterized protein YdaU (DUF1376 family)
MYYYKFNISDYKAHTEHLELLEDLAFRRMLDWMYLHEKPLPKEVKEIARFIRMRTHCDCITSVLQEFFTKTKEGFINERVAKELGDFQKKSALAKKSAEVRWKKKANKNNDLDNANACETQSESNANGMLNSKHKTVNIKQETVTNKKNNTLSSSVEEVLQGYNSVIDKHKPNWPKCQVLNKKRTSLITNALKLLKNRAEELNEKPTGYLIRLFGAMATDDKFFSGKPTQRNPEGYKCSFETNLKQDRLLQAIDNFTGE